LIKSEKNIGFAAANNLGLEHATSEMILFLNPDTQIVEGYLDDLVSWMGKQENVGIASCKLLSFAKNCCASLRPIRFPSLGALPAAFLNRRSFACAINRDALYPDFDDDKEHTVEIPANL